MAGVVKTANITASVREIDFVSRFSTSFEALKDLLSVSGMIKKDAGTDIKIKTAKVNTKLETSPAEGVAIPYTNYTITERALATLTIEKYRKGVSLEAIDKYGYDVAVAKTDDAFLNDLQAKITTDMFTSLKGAATGTSKKATWQAALAQAKAEVTDETDKLHLASSGAIAWVNLYDFYDYEGAAAITVQTQFGLKYVEDFMGFDKVFLCGSTQIAAGTVYATSTNNLDVYYVDASQSDFSKAGLAYTTDGEANLVGVHVGGNYDTAVADMFAIMGAQIVPEYANILRKVTIGTV